MQGANAVIWGTDVSVNQCKAKMAKFIQKFVKPDAADNETFVNMDAGAPYYLQRLEEIADVKKGILLQLFGGNSKDFSKTMRGQFRSELNILLCGDPDTSKSQLLQYVHHLIPRSQMEAGVLELALEGIDMDTGNPNHVMFPDLHHYVYYVVLLIRFYPINSDCHPD